MPPNFYKPYDRDKANKYFSTLIQAENEKLEAFLIEQIPVEVIYTSSISGETAVYYLRESVKKMIDTLGRSYVKTEEEEKYLRLTREVNQIKNQLNEAEKEKICLQDRIKEVADMIDGLNEAYADALDVMLSASNKVGE
jgi:predicted  nucleic acid-binding Zn-ribbon protein